MRVGERGEFMGARLEFRVGWSGWTRPPTIGGGGGVAGSKQGAAEALPVNCDWEHILLSQILAPLQWDYIGDISVYMVYI